MIVKTSKRDYRPFHIYFIPDEGSARWDKQGWADADQAMGYGKFATFSMFGGQTVEIVVVDTRTKLAVRSAKVVNNGE